MRLPVPIEIGPLSPAVQDAVRSLADDAARHDGVAPLSEQPLLRLGVDDAATTHVVVRSKAGGTVGYLQVDRSGDVASAELVVHPHARREGIGSLLLRTALRDARLPERSGAPDQRGRPLRLWAHGDLGPAREFAAARGLTAVRELLFLARPVGADDDLPAPDLPDGLVLRAFVPGQDDEAWVALNAAAFAGHPEQGRLTVEDLHDRTAEPWFDPAGFLLLQRPDGSLAGSVWTKVAPGQPESPGGEVDGEIYAVGTAPDARGQGLGTALTAAGIAHLARAGCDRVVLYVDGDNTAARRTYDRLGFAPAAVDVQYAPA